jgi:hypothetical protein
MKPASSVSLQSEARKDHLGACDTAQALQDKESAFRGMSGFFTFLAQSIKLYEMIRNPKVVLS